jgi:hypothetical protein
MAGLVPRRGARQRACRRAAVLGYLTVPVFGMAVVIYLATPRGSGWARRHTAQAVNVWFTGLFYDLSAVIMGAMLALDSPPVALMVFGPLVAARWLVTLVYLAGVVCGHCANDHKRMWSSCQRPQTAKRSIRARPSTRRPSADADARRPGCPNRCDTLSRHDCSNHDEPGGHPERSEWQPHP